MVLSDIRFMPDQDVEIPRGWKSNPKPGSKSEPVQKGKSIWPGDNVEPYFFEA